MPVRHRADFKEAVSTLRRLKNQEDQAYYQNWWQSSSSTMVKRSIEQDVRNLNFGARYGNYERNAVVKNQGTNSVYKEFLEIVGSGKPTGSVLKETIAVSATILISVEKLHHEIRLRILSCSRMSENHREPDVPGAELSVVACLDGFARITSKELATTHSVKSGILQNACSTRPRAVVGLWRSAHSHIVRLINSRRKDLKRMMTKVLWLCWKRKIGKRENLSQMVVTIDRGNLGREVIRNRDKIHPNVSFLMHDNWVAYFRTWRRRSLFSGRALTCRNQSNVWSSQRLLHVIPKFETKIPRSVTFVQVNLISVAPTLQNLSIGLKRRQSGKSKVPAKQRGSWPKECLNWVSIKGRHSSRLRGVGVSLHQCWNLRKENLLSTPERQCTWSAKRTWVKLKWTLWRNRAVLWCAVVSEFLHFTFYFYLLFSFLFLSFFLMSDYDYDSVTNNLRDPANGTFVTLDDFSPLTRGPMWWSYVCVSCGRV